MTSKHLLVIPVKHVFALQQAKRHARCMGTLAFQYLNSQSEHNSESVEWSKSLSFASPESDFVGSSFAGKSTVKASEWSHSLSFTSPEADFTASRVPETIKQQIQRPVYSNSGMLMSSPESAFGDVHVAEYMSESMKVKFLESQGIQYKHAKQEAMFQEFVDNMTFMASPETASGFLSCAEMLDDESKAALSRLQSTIDAIPKTLKDAMTDDRPIVVTSLTSPFDIVDVNQAWVGLCGYERDEAVNQNLGKLLQGPDTNIQTAQSMISQLRREHFASAMITNYTKDGRKFRNNVRAGIISDDEGNAKYFVGVLEETYENEAEKVLM